MVCSNCGKHIPDGSLTCVNCGGFQVTNCYGYYESNAGHRSSNISIVKPASATGNSYAVAAFVLSLLSLIGSVPVAIVSIVLSVMATKEGTDKKGFVLASRIISIAYMALLIFCGIVFVLMFFLFMLGAPYC